MKEKTGLVLEGGALRGLFSAGVMDVLMENGVEFDGIIGVSAGAAFGCNYKSRQPGRAIRYNMKFAKDWRYCSVRSLIKTGDLFGGEFDYHYLPTYLDIFDTKAFDENPMEFYAVCTDVETGKAVYKKLDKCSYECYEWIRASASMPLASKIVKTARRRHQRQHPPEILPKHRLRTKPCGDHTTRGIPERKEPAAAPDSAFNAKIPPFHRGLQQSAPDV